MMMNRTGTDGQARKIAGGTPMPAARGSGTKTTSEWTPISAQGRKRPGIAIPVAFDMEQPWASKVLAGRVN